jgi:hypothetical protein
MTTAARLQGAFPGTAQAYNSFMGDNAISMFVKNAISKAGTGKSIYQSFMGGNSFYQRGLINKGLIAQGKASSSQLAQAVMAEVYSGGVPLTALGYGMAPKIKGSIKDYNTPYTPTSGEAAMYKIGNDQRAKEVGNATLGQMLQTLAGASSDAGKSLANFKNAVDDATVSLTSLGSLGNGWMTTNFPTAYTGSTSSSVSQHHGSSNSVKDLYNNGYGNGAKMADLNAKLMKANAAGL